MKLTKRQAIEGHRKMWKWITDEIKSRKQACIIADLKQKYCKTNNLTLRGDCFCCEYNEGNHGCSKCPVDWVETPHCCTNEYSLYHKIIWSKSWQEQYELARQIANLPERVVIENEEI